MMEGKTSESSIMQVTLWCSTVYVMSSMHALPNIQRENDTRTNVGTFTFRYLKEANLFRRQFISFAQETWQSRCKIRIHFSLPPYLIDLLDFFYSILFLFFSSKFSNLASWPYFPNVTASFVMLTLNVTGHGDGDQSGSSVLSLLQEDHENPVWDPSWVLRLYLI